MQVFSGDGTYYLPANGYGACGNILQNNDMVAAISHTTFDITTINGNPNNNPICGSCINVTGPTGLSIQVTLQDRCAACVPGDLDLTLYAFSQIADPTLGRVHVTWSFCDVNVPPATTSTSKLKCAVTSYTDVVFTSASVETCTKSKLR